MRQLTLTVVVWASGAFEEVTQEAIAKHVEMVIDAGGKGQMEAMEVVVVSESKITTQY